MKYNPVIRLCLFCKQTPSEGATFKDEEHIFSESLGNHEIILRPGIVCDDCNGHFSQLENKFIHTYAGLFGRFISTDRTKKGRSPQTSLPNSGNIKRIKGTKNIYLHQFVGNPNYLDLKPQLIPDKKPITVAIIHLPSEDLNNTSRLLAKMALELLYPYAPGHAFSPVFDTIRVYARRGPYRKIQFIPFAWSPSVAQPFQHRIYEENRQGQTISLLMWFSLPGIQYLYPMYLSTSLAFFLTTAKTMNLKVETQGKISGPVYCGINMELGHYSGRQLYRQLIGIE